MTLILTLPTADTTPDIVVTLSNAAGVQNLTGATVALRYRKNGTLVPVTSLACTVDAPGTLGVARHVRSGADGFVAGVYDTQVQVTYVGGKVQTFPTQGWMTLVMVDPI